METTTYWLMFFSAALAINLSPGPDMFFVLSKTISGGRKTGIASSAGVCTGAVVHILAAAFGLSAILSTSALAFSIVKYIGAAYLLYLAIQSFRSGVKPLKLSEEKIVSKPWEAFRQGVLIDILNPKAALFFMAFLPQFVRQGSGSAEKQIIILGFLVIAVAVFTEALLVLAASKAVIFLRERKSFSGIMNYIQGSVMIFLALKLALMEQKNN